MEMREGGGTMDDDAAIVVQGHVARCDFTVCLVCFICSWGVDLINDIYTTYILTMAAPFLLFSFSQSLERMFCLTLLHKVFKSTLCSHPLTRIFNHQNQQTA